MRDFHAPPSSAFNASREWYPLSAPREQAFARTMRHSAFKEAVERGAVPLWMPRLLPAKEVEDRRVKFTQPMNGDVPEGRKLTPLGPFDRSRIRDWMGRMSASFAPVASWIP